MTSSSDHSNSEENYSFHNEDFLRLTRSFDDGRLKSSYKTLSLTKDGRYKDFDRSISRSFVKHLASNSSSNRIRSIQTLDDSVHTTLRSREQSFYNLVTKEGSVYQDDHRLVKGSKEQKNRDRVRVFVQYYLLMMLIFLHAHDLFSFQW